MILIGRYLSPFVRRVAISMQLLEMPFERKELNTKDDFAELVKINPLGRVPALVLDNGDVLIDSSSILDYIDQQAGPERAWIPAAGSERLRVQNMLGILQGISDKTLAVNFERLNHPEAERNQAWLERCETQVRGGLAALENAAGEPWLCGDKMTQADITLVCILDMTQRILPGLLERETYPKLHAVLDRCNALPEVVNTRFVAN